MTPHDKLRQIIEENPNADRSVLLEQFRREVMDDPDLQRAVAEDLLNEFLFGRKPTKPQDPVAHDAR